MSEHNVLYIVEGCDDKKLMDKLWNRFEPENKYETYVFSTNIHVLIDLLFEGDELDEDLDLLKVLRSECSDRDPEGILKKKFQYIYLVFDFDPHDKKTDVVKIGKLMDFLRDPADNGRLFLNYPMVESYRHMKDPDDKEFISRTIPMEVLRTGKYKETVDRESGNMMKQNASYTKEFFISVIKAHLRKENYILTSRPDMMSEEEFFEISGSEVLSRQVESMEHDGVLFVLNTCIFNIVEYMPSNFFDE